MTVLIQTRILSFAIKLSSIQIRVAHRTEKHSRLMQKLSHKLELENNGN